MKTMVDAVPAIVSDKTVEMFERLNVMSRVELEARAEIDYETYAKAINIEAKTMINMAGKKYIPSVINYVTDLAASINEIKAACESVDVSVQTELLSECSTLLAEAKKALKKLETSVAEAAEKEEGKEQAEFFKDVVFKDMEALRAPIDALEMKVGKEYWPVPTYGDLLFEV